MGNEEVKEVHSQPQWVWASNEKGVQIYRSKDGKLGERRRIVIMGNYALSQQRKVYDFRSTNPYGLVRSYQAVVLEKEKKSQNVSDICRCANQKIQLDVYTQRIAYRLSDLPQLTFPQSLLFLKQTAMAYEVAYKKLGGLHINPQLIGVTDKGEVRAWVNENWALNHPSHYIPILKCSSKQQPFGGINPQLRDQSEMISNLISVIEEKNENGVFPSPFGQLLRSKSSNFRSLRRFLNEYITTNNILLPELINKNDINQAPSYNSVNQKNVLYPVQTKTPVINSSQDSYDTEFQRANQSYRPVFVNIPSIPLTNFNSAKYAFQNEIKPNAIPIQQESIFPINYASSYSSPFPKFSPRPQLINIQKQQISSLQGTYRPYKYEPRLQTNSQSSSTDKPLFNGLRFSLLPSLQLGQERQGVTDVSSKPVSPLLSLNQLPEKDEVRHMASYQIVDPNRNVTA